MHALLVLGLLATGAEIRAEPTVTPPGWLKLDGKWYAWNAEVQVDPFTASIYARSVSAYNCVRPGGSAPRYADFVAEIGPNGQVYYIKTFAVDTNANALVLTTYDGDVTCAGQVQAPTTPEAPIFKNGFD